MRRRRVNHIGSPSLYEQYPRGLDLRFAQNGALPGGGTTVTFTRSGNATYRDSTGTRQTAGTNVARFDHDASGTPLGLLIEGARTNSFLNSDTPATHTSPSLGTATYTLWIEGTGSVEVAGNTATITGAGTATEGSPVTFTVTGAGTVDFTVTGDVDIAQCENGAFASSYIPTEGSAVTRNADVATITDMSWFNASEGTFLVEASPVAFVGAAGSINVLDVSDGTSGNQMEVVWDSSVSQWRWRGRSSSVEQWAINMGAAQNGRADKMAFAYKANDIAAVLNGGTVSADTSATVPSGLTRLDLGRRGAGDRYFFGHLRRVVYWPSRLPNGILQKFTV